MPVVDQRRILREELIEVEKVSGVKSNSVEILPSQLAVGKYSETRNFVV